MLESTGPSRRWWGLGSRPLQHSRYPSKGSCSRVAEGLAFGLQNTGRPRSPAERSLPVSQERPRAKAGADFRVLDWDRRHRRELFGIYAGTGMHLCAQPELVCRHVCPSSVRWGGRYRIASPPCAFGQKVPVLVFKCMLTNIYMAFGGQGCALPQTGEGP